VTKVHHKKIEHSHLVLVIPKPDGSVGEHTTADILHARKYEVPVFTVFDYDSKFNDSVD